MKEVTIVEANVFMGKIYKDSITEFEGVVVAVVANSHSISLRICLQPKVSDKGILPDNKWFDEESLINVIPVKKGGQVNFYFKTNAIFGEKYTCKTTGFKGKLTQLIKCQYGCIRATIQPKVDRKGEIPDAWDLDELSLEGVTAYDDNPGGLMVISSQK